MAYNDPVSVGVPSTPTTTTTQTPVSVTARSTPAPSAPTTTAPQPAQVQTWARDQLSGKTITGVSDDRLTVYFNGGEATFGQDVTKPLNIASGPVHTNNVLQVLPGQSVYASDVISQFSANKMLGDLNNNPYLRESGGGLVLRVPGQYGLGGYDIPIVMDVPGTQLSKIAGTNERLNQAASYTAGMRAAANPAPYANLSDEQYKNQLLAITAPVQKTGSAVTVEQKTPSDTATIKTPAGTGLIIGSLSASGEKIANPAIAERVNNEIDLANARIGLANQVALGQAQKQAYADNAKIFGIVPNPFLQYEKPASDFINSVSYKNPNPSGMQKGVDQFKTLIGADAVKAINNNPGAQFLTGIVTGYGENVAKYPIKSTVEAGIAYGVAKVLPLVSSSLATTAQGTGTASKVAKAAPYVGKGVAIGLGGAYAVIEGTNVLSKPTATEKGQEVGRSLAQDITPIMVGFSLATKPMPGGTALKNYWINRGGLSGIIETPAGSPISYDLTTTTGKGNPGMGTPASAGSAPSRYNLKQITAGSTLIPVDIGIEMANVGNTLKMPSARDIVPVYELVKKPSPSKPYGDYTFRGVGSSAGDTVDLVQVFEKIVYPVGRSKTVFDVPTIGDVRNINLLNPWKPIPESTGGSKVTLVKPVTISQEATGTLWKTVTTKTKYQKPAPAPQEVNFVELGKATTINTKGKTTIIPHDLIHATATEAGYVDLTGRVAPPGMGTRVFRPDGSGTSTRVPTGTGTIQVFRPKTSSLGKGEVTTTTTRDYFDVTAEHPRGGFAEENPINLDFLNIQKETRNKANYPALREDVTYGDAWESYKAKKFLQEQARRKTAQEKKNKYVDSLPLWDTDAQRKVSPVGLYEDAYRAMLSKRVSKEELVRRERQAERERQAVAIVGSQGTTLSPNQNEKQRKEVYPLIRPIVATDTGTTQKPARSVTPSIKPITIQPQKQVQPQKQTPIGNTPRPVKITVPTVTPIPAVIPKIPTQPIVPVVPGIPDTPVPPVPTKPTVPAVVGGFPSGSSGGRGRRGSAFSKYREWIPVWSPQAMMGGVGVRKTKLSKRVGIRPVASVKKIISPKITPVTVRIPKTKAPSIPKVKFPSFKSKSTKPKATGRRGKKR